MNEIKVGMGVTHYCGSDCYPFEVVKVIHQKRLVIRSMNAVAGPGHDYYGHQNWVITPNPQGEEIIIRKTKRGWNTPGSTPCRGHGYGVGSAHRKEDPSF